MLSCGFTPPKYTDSRPEHHFQVVSRFNKELTPLKIIPKTRNAFHACTSTLATLATFHNHYFS